MKINRLRFVIVKDNCYVCIEVITNQSNQNTMYYLHEDSPSGTTIIEKFKSVEKAKQKKLEMENLDAENGYYCNYFITKLI